LPNIGHADAIHRPDIPNLIWNDERLITQNQRVHNKSKVIEAARYLFERLSLFVDRNISSEALRAKWSSLELDLSNAIGPETESERDMSSERINSYMALAEDLPIYNKQLWFDDAIETYEEEIDLPDNMTTTLTKFLKKPDFNQSD
jgi:hypothetical protein